MSDDKRWDESLGVARGRTSTWADRQVAGLCQTAFVEGVRWADANPQPTTITREELEEFKVAWHDADKRGRAGSRVAAGLNAIGIRVEDER